METTESKAISILSGYMYFADISIVNSGMHEAYAHVYHLVIFEYNTSLAIAKLVSCANIVNVLCFMYTRSTEMKN